MKLISLNIEMKKHYDTVLPFIDTENPDVLCLQEAPKEMTEMLEKRKFHTAFLPSILRTDLPGDPYPEGIILASKTPFTDLKNEYYFQPDANILPNDDNRPRETYSKGFIMATVNDIALVTTHFTWTPKGRDPNTDQIEDTSTLLKLLEDAPPHILCGDMNIPRHHSFLYEKFLEDYEDTIPKKYVSSLDKTKHRLGNDSEKEILFTNYMVDYIFTQQPYRAENVRLEFGISDHAAVLANIYKN